MPLLNRLVLSALLLAPCVVLGADGGASAKSIQELIDVTHARQLLDGAMAQMDSVMKQSLQQALADKQLTTEQQGIVNEMQGKMLALMKQELNWDSLAPTISEAYQKSFTEAEVAGMLKFYRSPSGRAVIDKMPVLMQQTTQLMTGRMATLVPKLQEIEREAMQKMQAATPAPEAQPAPPAAAPAPEPAPQSK